MTGFEIKTLENAPEGSRDTLDAVQEKVGFIPNIYGVMAQAPTALQALAALNGAFEATSFTPQEREIIALATSVTNECGYCVAGHTAFAVALEMDPEIIRAMRCGRPSPDPRLEALNSMTRALLKKKGDVDHEDIGAFLAAGFSKAQILELLIGIAGKIMTNFASKAGQVPLDFEFMEHAWVSPYDLYTNEKAA